MATMRARFGKLVVDFRYMGVRCREKTAFADMSYAEETVEVNLVN